MLGLYYEHKEKKRKEHDSWVYYRERELRNISDRFEQACFEATEDTFKKYTWNVRFCEWHCTLEKDSSFVLSKHQRTIDDLEQDYIENFQEKYTDEYASRRIDDLPTHLKEEYYQRIKDIASRYRHINYTMMMRIQTMSSKFINENEIEHK